MPLLDPWTKLAPSAAAAGPVGPDLSRRIDVVWAAFPPSGGGDAVPLYHRYYDDATGWVPQDGWFARGGQWSSAVTIAAFTDGQIEVFGQGPGGGLQHFSASGELLTGPGIWSPESLGVPPAQVIVSAPGTAALGPTAPAAVVRTTDNGRPDWSFAFIEPNTTPENPFGYTWVWQSFAQLEDRFWPPVQTDFATAPALVWPYAGALAMFVVDEHNRLLYTGISEGTGVPWRVITETPTVTSSPAAVVWRNELAPADSLINVVSCLGPFPGLEPIPGAVLLKIGNASRWSADISIYISGTTSAEGGAGDGRTILSPPAVASWYEPRLDVFFVSAADEFGNDLKMTHGWSEAPDNPGLWGWELFPLPG